MKTIEQLQELSEYLDEVIAWAMKEKAIIDKEILLKTLLLRIRGEK